MKQKKAVEMGIPEEYIQQKHAIELMAPEETGT